MEESPTAAGEAGLHLVVVGASAGGIEALRTLVASLPAGFPAPVVLAQHLDPNRPSQLEQILAGTGPLPVVTVTADRPLEPGVVYVLPPGRDAVISDHHVGLHRAVGHSRPSIDRVLSTAAAVFGENLIAVVLTGLGEDGAAGAQAVKAYGGTVVVQNPKTARFPSMPQAVPPGAVDVVADLEAIGSLLADLVTGRYGVPEPGADDEMAVLLERIHRQTGLDFGAYKRPTIQRRLARRMAAVGAATLADYRRHLERDPEEVHRVAAAFLIKVTRFVRDPELFDYLRERVLPTLIAEARARGELRLWSAGCATGEEAYSLAMLVADLLRVEAAPPAVRIFATDVAPDAVDFARRGVYPEAALAGLPPDLVERHFVRLDGAWEVRREVRGLAVFGEHDLGQRAPFPRIDLVLCRNVLIYFAPALQRHTLKLFAFSLRPGGYLALGAAESVNPLPEYFALEQPRLKVFRRLEAAAPVSLAAVPDVSVLDVSGLGIRPPNRPPPRRLAPLAGPVAAGERRWQASGTIERLSVGVVVVDRHYDVLEINQAARELLSIHTAAVGEDLVHAVHRALATPLRTAIDAAFGGEPTSAVHRLPRDVVNATGHDVLLSCSPIAADGETRIEAVAVEVLDVTAFVQAQREAEEAHHRTEAERAELAARTAEAAAEVRSLRAANRALAADLSRLRLENEQIQLSNEETQAAAEEIETLNEELQATNEELETLNEELQATVEELKTTNDELQARSVEALTTSAELELRRGEVETERERMAAVLATMSDAVLVVKPDGEVALTNAAYDRAFGPGADWAPEDEQGRPLPPEEWPQRRVARGEAFTTLFTRQREGEERCWFEAAAQPIRGNGATLGVLVIRDVTDRSLRHLQEQFLAVAVHELRTPLTALIGRLQLLARRLEREGADANLRHQAALALDQARRLADDVTDLMDAARVQAGRLRLDPTPLDLRDIVRAAVETATPLAADTPIRVEAREAPVPVQGDPRRLGRVILNLVANALAHAPSPDGVDVRVRTEVESAVVEVADRGPGIAPEHLPRLFERFFQTDGGGSGRGGLGLGLFIAKEIVEAHGGTIEARSVPGEGATFAVRLPLCGAS